MKVSLTDICDFQGGTQPPKDEWIDQPAQGYVRMLQIRDFTQSDKNYIEYVKDTGKLKTCIEDDILIGRYGASIGKILTGLAGAYNVAIVKTIPDEKVVSKKYLYWYLNSQYFQRFISNVGSRAAQAGFNKNDLGAAQIPLVDKERQKEICEVLEKANKLISLRKQQLAKLDELVKARFVEMFGERFSIRPQKLKEVTRRVKVGFVGTCEKYYTDNTGVPMLRTTNITSHGIDLKDLKYVTRTFHEKNLKSRVHKGDLLIARHGSNGQANVYCGDEAQCLNAIIIEPDHNITNPIFLENLINSRSVKRQIEKELVGSTQHVLNTTTLANVEVKIPAIKEQQVFAAFVERVDQQKQTVQQSLEKLELMKKALMQEYFG